MKHFTLRGHAKLARGAFEIPLRGKHQFRTHQTQRRLTFARCFQPFSIPHSPFPISSARITIATLIALLVLITPSCTRTSGKIAALPDKFEVDIGELQIRSDVDIDAGDPILEELKELRREIVKTLQLPPPHRPVVVHLFADEQRYETYMAKAHPGLPPRRAFFIGSPTELAVFAHWSPNVIEDLRHEYTHGVLHASLRTVPLWLDEGLAEYFEVRTRDLDRRHPEHAPQLAIALSNGWRPNLKRLEQIDSVAQMQRADYQEAWAWVHYLLHETDDGQQMLTDYCSSLRKSDKPPRFSTLLAEHFSEPDIRLASHLSGSLGFNDEPEWARE